jgi:hypothetical protein
MAKAGNGQNINAAANPGHQLEDLSRMISLYEIFITISQSFGFLSPLSLRLAIAYNFVYR